MAIGPARFPKPLTKAMKEVHDANESIDDIGFSSGGRMVFRQEQDKLLLLRDLERMRGDARRSFFEAHEEVSKIAFLPSGGIMIARGANGWWSDVPVPEQMLEADKATAKHQWQRIQCVALGAKRRVDHCAFRHVDAPRRKASLHHGHCNSNSMSAAASSFAAGYEAFESWHQHQTFP